MTRFTSINKSLNKVIKPVKVSNKFETIVKPVKDMELFRNNKDSALQFFGFIQKFYS